MEASNVKAMREALMEASIALSSATHHHMTEDDAKDCLAVIETAISEQPRNCDVGTEQEQFERFDRWCNSRVFKNCLGLDCRKCFIAWSQTPYEDASETKDYSNVRAVCFDCARKAGFVQKKKAVIVFEDECGICKARRPCTDLRNDWMPPKKESDVK